MADGPHLNLDIDVLFYYQNNGELTHLLRQQLEHMEATRLIHHMRNVQLYEADIEMAWRFAEKQEADARKAEILAQENDEAGE